MVRKVAGCGTCTGLGITATLSLVALVVLFLFFCFVFYCSMASTLAEAAGKDAEPTEG